MSILKDNLAYDLTRRLLKLSDFTSFLDDAKRVDSFDAATTEEGSLRSSKAQELNDPPKRMRRAWETYICVFRLVAKLPDTV